VSRRELELLREANPVPGVMPGRRSLPVARIALVAVLAVLVVVGAGPALGLHLPALDFGKAEKAPAPIERDFATLSAGAPKGMDPGVIAGETRRVTTVRLSDGPHTLWVAPTRAGGLCELWTGWGGGCDKLGTVPLSVTWGGIRDIQVVGGFVRARWSRSVQIERDDGTTVTPPLVWVSDPIGVGFYLYELPPGRTAVAVRALDPDGNVVTETRPGGATTTALLDALQDEKRKAFVLETSRGPATVWIAPTRYDGRCFWLEFEDKVFPVRRCAPKGYEHETGIGARFVRTADAVLLLAWVGDGVDSAELTFTDGDSLVARAQDNVMLAEVPEEHFALGHELAHVRYLAPDGSLIVDIPSSPDAAAPCSTITPLPESSPDCGR
jgi:hypothetical protein